MSAAVLDAIYTTPPPTPPPAAPTNLTAGSSGSLNQVLLSWSASAGATSYNVYEGASGAETLLHSGTVGTSYTDTSPTVAGVRFYVVTAVGPGGESAKSNEAKALMVLPSIVQTATVVSGGAGSGGSFTVSSWPQNVTAGNALIVFAGTTGGNFPPYVVTSVTDGGDIFSQAVQQNNGTLDAAIYYSHNVAGGSKPTIIITLNGNTGFNVIGGAFEVAGLVVAAPEGTNSNTGTGTATTTGNVTTTHAIDLLVASVITGGSNAITPPTGFTTQGNVTNIGDGSEKIVSATGTYNPAYALQTSATWVSVLAAFKGGLAVSNGIAYYLNNSGSDSGNGTTTLTAWQTPTHASAFTGFKPGDTLALAAGQNFNDSITLTTANFTTLPTSALPFFVSTYGAGGNATLGGGTGSALSVTNVPNVQVNNLYCRSSGVTVTLGTPNTSATSSTAAAIYFTNNGAVKIIGPTFTNVTATGGIKGISLYTGSASVGFDGAALTNCNVFGNLNYGLQIGSDTYTIQQLTGAHSNLTITGSQFHDNCGFASTDNNAGYGCWLNSVNGVTVNNSVAYNNGVASATTTSSGGPVGFETYNCSNVTYNNCEARTQHDQSGVDGEGFDIGSNSSNIVFNNCYAHDNTNVGLSVFGVFGLINGVTFNSCISQNNGVAAGLSQLRMSSQHAINVFAINCDFSSTAGYLVDNLSNSNVTVTNCYLNAQGTANHAFLKSGDVLVNNQYEGTFAISYNNPGGVNYTSLAAVHTASIANFEHVGSTNYGQTGAALLVNAGGGGSFLPGSQVTTMTAYDPTASSPTIDAGINTTTVLGITQPATDFHGNPSSVSGNYDIGAVKYQGH